MLVLSRRRNDKILFPNLDITVEILKVDGRTVRIGVEAPKDVAIQRHELAERDAASSPNSRKQKQKSKPPVTRSLEQERLRRRVFAAATALNDLHSRFDESQRREFEDAVFGVFHELKALDTQLGGKNAPASQAAARPKKRSALLVDDNENESKLLAGYLRCQDFDVSLAHEGGAAIDYLDSHEQPDVVLLDMQMPGMDGPTTIRQIRSRSSLEGLRVIAVSGGDPTDYGVELGPEGVDGWFPKPLDPESLIFRLAVNNPVAAPAI